MRVSSSRRSRSGSGASLVPTIGALLLILGVFYVAARWFRADAVPVTEVAAITDVLPAVESLQAFVPEAALVGPDGSSGTAHRSMAGGIYSIALSARLPEIDRARTHYEAWLLEQSPYHFFSLGEMVTDETGAFIVRWEGKLGEEYLDYGEVIVTREANDANPDPSTHVLRGVFE